MWLNQSTATWWKEPERRGLDQDLSQCDHCLEKMTTPLSRQVFCAAFKKMDLKFCDPKKDRACYGTTGNQFHELWEEQCMERGAPGPEVEKVGNQ